MGLIKAGLYIGAATYIINKITDEKKNHKSDSAPQNTRYPPPQQYQDNRGCPPQYEQYIAPPQQQQQKSSYYDTNAPDETQYRASQPTQYGREDRGEPARPYQSRIDDAPISRQWPEAQPTKSSKW